MAIRRPHQVVFVDVRWYGFGVKAAYQGPHVTGSLPILDQNIEAITAVPAPLLNRESQGGIQVRSFSVARRMSWASRRSTTRAEDRAYCLLGLLGIKMPLVNGEGLDAFMRLQHKILRHELGESLFAWGSTTRY